MHNRIIYQNQALYVGPTPSTGGHYRNPAGTKVTDAPQISGIVSQLHRIQNVNYSWTVNRQNVNQFGELAAIDRVILETPTVALSFSYLQANFWNEEKLGFHTSGNHSALSGILNKTQDDKNYFLKVVGQGVDAVKDTTSDTDVFVMGFGNGFLTSYTAQGAINTFPSVDVSIEALNMTFDTGISGFIPAVTPANGTRINNSRFALPVATGSPGIGDLDISVLRPGDITLSFKKREAHDEGILLNASDPYDTAGVDIDNAHIQSYNIAFTLGREAIQKLGNRFAHSREITPPIDITMSIDAIVTNLTTGSLHDLVNCDSAYDLTVNLKKPNCPTTAEKVICRYVLKNAKLDSQTYSSDIGSNKTVTLNFSSQVGGPNQNTIGLFMSGITQSDV